MRVQIVADCNQKDYYILLYISVGFFLAMTQPLTYENVSHLGLSLQQFLEQVGAN